MVSPLPRKITSGIAAAARRGCGRPRGRRADEPDRARRQACTLESRAQHLVDEHGHRAQRGAAGAQDDRVQALQELPGDVERDVRPGLEVRADRADRDPPLADLEAVGQRPRAEVALERLDRCGRRHLFGEALDTLLVKAQPVERRLVETPGGGLIVGLVRRQDRGAALPDECCGLAERGGDGVVAEEGGARLAATASCSTWARGSTGYPG